ncbi:MAG: CdaR family protein [bacterium]
MRLRALILENLLAKIFSLVFAVVLWAVVIGEKHGQMQLTVPLELINIPEKAVVVSEVPSNLSVLVQGPRTLLRTLSARDVRRTVDLKGVGVGWTTIRILPDSIPIPRGVEVIRVTPTTLDLKLEPLREVSLTVVPQITGDVGYGYRIENVSVEPPKVLLRGGESELMGLSEVRTRPVSIAQATSDLEEKVGLELEGLHLVGISPTKVSVKVKVVPLQMERAIEHVVVRVAQQDVNFELEPKEVMVMVKGPLHIVETLKETDLQATVVVQGLSAGKHTVAVSVSAPQGVRVTRIEPPRVNVSLESQ